jgi:hypothetical protein
MWDIGHPSHPHLLLTFKVYLNEKGRFVMSQQDPGIEEIKNKIIDWINNDLAIQFDAVINGRYSEEYAHLLSIDHPDIAHLSIYKPDLKSQKLSVYAKVEFSPEESNAFNALPDKIQKVIAIDIADRLTLMNLLVMPLFRRDKKQIHFQDQIYFDGLTKDRLMNSISKINNAYAQIILILGKHGIVRKGFDPSKYV